MSKLLAIDLFCGLGGWTYGLLAERRAGSKSTARKAASSLIAEIPLPLSRHIGRSCLPQRKIVAA